MYEITINSILSKNQLQIMSESMVQEIIDNNKLIDAADTIMKMEYLIKSIKDNPDYKDSLVSEIGKHGKYMNTYTGNRLELAEVGVKYDYSNCHDLELKEMEKQLEILEAKIKERKDFLKKLPAHGLEILRGDELLKIYPPSKSSSTGYKSILK